MHPFKAIKLLIIPVSLLMFIGCLGELQLHPEGEIVFNQRLRADTGASQGMADLMFYSDGGSKNDQIISELYHSTINSNTLGKLKKSTCFWVEGDGFPILSYEPILKNGTLYDDDELMCTVEAMGACGVSMTEPESRKAIFCDGKNCDIPPEGLPFTIGWRACTEGGTPREVDYSQCVPLQNNCTAHDTANLSAELSNPAPFCMVRAPLPSMLTDTSLELQPLSHTLDVLYEDFKNLNTEPHKVLPHMKVIMGSRTLARPLIYARWLEHDPDDHPDSDRYYWQWQVPSEGNGWKENFSPHLKVNTVRVFVERGNDAETGIPIREYLTVRNVHAGGTRCRGEENPDIGGTEFHLIDCAMDVTPVYDKAHLIQDYPIDDAQRLKWEAEFVVVGVNDIFGKPPVEEGEPVYIEFEVVDTLFGTSGNSLRIAPGGISLGNVQLGSSPEFERVFTVMNEGMADVIVDGITIEGPDAGDFSAWVDSGKLLPMTLRAGGSFDITLGTHTQTWGRKNAAVVVKAQDGAGQSFEIRATVVANATDAILGVAPDIMAFFREDGDQNPKEYVRRFLIENPGSLDLHRRDITITGPNASFFTVVSSRYNATEDSPPPTSRWIASALDETFTVLYHPTSPGMHSARIDIDSDAGQETIDLHGLCYGTCNYAP